MVKRTKKRQRSDNSDGSPNINQLGGGWKKVDVGLVSDDFIEDQKNHYDDSKLASKADFDLEADPKEHLGAFFGLEVLDGSQYEVIDDKETGCKKFIIRDNSRNTTKEKQNNENSSSPIKEQSESLVVSKKKSKKKKKKKSPKETKIKEVKIIEGSNTSSDKEDDNKTAQDKLQHEEQLELIQSQWQATGGITLHSTLYEALLKNKWDHPTPIQAAVLPAAILGRRNIVGAAPTGSGKTLAFLLPIYQYLLEKHDEKQLQGESETTHPCLEALILTPTRELALQINEEAQKLWKGHIGTLVGGLAVAKQQRVLDKNRPSVIAATPGRLWDLISSREHEHLNDLSQIRFLVIDEADRMIQQGSFPQLSQILDTIQMANPMEDSDDDESVESLNDDNDRLFGLPGIRGEAKVTMLSNDILEKIEKMKHNSSESVNHVDSDTNYVDSYTNHVDSDAPDELESCDKSDSISLPTLPPVKRQTFVYSATLALPSSSSSQHKVSKSSRKKNGTVEGAIAEILEKARAKGPTKIIDLTKAKISSNERAVATKEGKSSQSGQKATSDKEAHLKTSNLHLRLPDGLTLQEIKCTQMHKDSFLYAYLMTTSFGSAGPALVFCSSIAAVRRVGSTLTVLGLPVRTLHAKMEQRSRFKAIESLHGDKKSRCIVVATDVAARGLDIPSVSTVVHYDAARTMDAFIHRSGRTARGMGKDAVGCSLSLVSPDEDKFHAAIIRTFNIEFDQVLLDGRLLKSAQERVNLACKVVIAEGKQSKAQRENQWFKDNAGAAGIEMDESCIDETTEALSSSEKSSRESRIAKGQLQRLLSQPMQTQKFGKFLSTNSALGQNQSDQFVVRPSKVPSRKRRR